MADEKRMEKRPHTKKITWRTKNGILKTRIKHKQKKINEIKEEQKMEF